MRIHPTRPGCAALLALAALLGCRAEPPGPPPYGFGATPRQSFRLVGHDTTEVDGTTVEIERLADLKLDGEPAAPGKLELVVRLARYYMRVKGAPGGPTEFAISDHGLVTGGGGREGVRVAPDESDPNGPLSRLLEDPVGGVLVDTTGTRLGTAWTGTNPVLAGIDVLDWMLLALPVLSADADPRWKGSRPLPPIGQYNFGIDLPLLFERQDQADGSSRVRATSVLQRTGLAVAAGLEGDVSIDLASEADLAPDGRIVRARVEMLVRFEATSGTRVASRHRLEVECIDCGLDVNPADPASDITVG
jgi:hypothetical protein